MLTNEANNSGNLWRGILGPLLVLVSIPGSFFIRREGKRNLSSAYSLIPTDDTRSDNDDIFTKETHKASIAKIQNREKEDLNASKFWSYAEALKRTGENAELLETRIQSFIADTPLMIHNLKESVEQGDFFNARLYAQLLKSSSANIAASTLRMMSKKLEFAAREQNKPSLKANIFECERIAKETLASLKKRGLHDNAATQKQFGHDVQDVSIKLGNLRQNIEKSIFVDTDTVKLFGEYSDSATADLMHELKRSVEKLEYEKALVLIQRLEKILK